MAHVNDNLITKGLSGKLGRMLVFRVVGEKTIVSAAPTGTRNTTPAQQQQRERFQQAVLYAKLQMADPESKADYAAAAKQHGKGTPYSVAVADFFNAPNITWVNVDEYHGRSGDKISIQVTDDFKVAGVSVEVLLANGSEVESGAAVWKDGNNTWEYTATTDNASLDGAKIIVKAHDVPGNETTREQAL